MPETTKPEAKKQDPKEVVLYKNPAGRYLLLPYATAADLIKDNKYNILQKQARRRPVPGSAYIVSLKADEYKAGKAAAQGNYDTEKGAKK